MQNEIGNDIIQSTRAAGAALTPSFIITARKLVSDYPPLLGEHHVLGFAPLLAAHKNQPEFLKRPQAVAHVPRLLFQGPPKLRRLP